MGVGEHPRAAALASTGLSPSDFPHAAGFRDQRAGVRICAHERHQFLPFPFRHQRLYVSQKSHGFHDRHRRIRQVSPTLRRHPNARWRPPATHTGAGPPRWTTVNGSAASSHRARTGATRRCHGPWCWRRSRSCQKCRDNPNGRWLPQIAAVGLANNLDRRIGFFGDGEPATVSGIRVGLPRFPSAPMLTVDISQLRETFTASRSKWLMITRVRPLRSRGRRDASSSRSGLSPTRIATPSIGPSSFSSHE